jgi:hypothetical protein
VEYRCVATSVDGFVQQLAVAYVQHGYWFHVTGTIPHGKDPLAVDRKLVDRYGLAISKWARARRKRQGLANVHYLRYERFFVLIATKGRHEFREREGKAIRDIRRHPIAFAGYSISCRRGVDQQWHASVRMLPIRYRELKAFVLELAARSASTHIAAVIANTWLLPYAPVKRQLLNIVRAVNRVRRIAGLDDVAGSCVPQRRRIVRPFETNARPQGQAPELLAVP